MSKCIDGVDLERCHSSKYVNEIYTIIGKWIFRIEGFENDLVIQVYESGSRFFPEANYSIKTPEQDGFYRHLNSHETVSEALYQGLNGFLAYYKPERISETEFREEKLLG